MSDIENIDTIYTDLGKVKPEVMFRNTQAYKTHDEARYT